MAASPVIPVELEVSDIQGLVVRGYGTLPCASYLLLQVTDAPAARAYLEDLEPRINRASEKPATSALQIAFTAPGLAALGLSKETLETFSREFLEGMSDDVRAESLGDRHANDPATWTWGVPCRWPNEATDDTTDEVHAMLMVYGTKPDDLGVRDAAPRREPSASPTFAQVLAAEMAKLTGFRIIVEKTTVDLADGKEHFGWHDGISLPTFSGVPSTGRQGRPQESWTTPLAPGEFVLGYLNEYTCYTERPTADPSDDPHERLLVMPDGRKDLGRNGTYLVFREMRQHVHRLWSYLARSNEPGDERVDSAIALGSKMVGRFPNGTPLMTAKTDDPMRDGDNEFTYATTDPLGLACPLGAHIRRANPRDHLAADRDASDSRIMVRKHQMIRRGRSFGVPVSANMITHEIARAPEDDVERGLHFICLVGHIGRQFEFVQRAWLQSANFQALYKDGDPITAARRPEGDPNPNDEFTCPAVPVRRKYKGMPQFTTLVGGAYFFLPGLRALRVIARAAP